MAIAPKNFEFICELVAKHSAIVLGSDKQYLVVSRLYPIAKQSGFANIDALVDALRLMPSGSIVTSVVDAMTTNETSFFRDGMPFQILRDSVLPELIKKRKLSKTIRIWSGACSSGQEPYSLAILWREKFPDYRDWQFKILATDISKTMLDRAREGRFSALEIDRGLSKEQKLSHFSVTGDTWTARPELRASIEFKQLNLIQPYPVTLRADVVFLRNVLVYFGIESKRDILNRIRQVLAPDGYLFLGGAETTVMLDDAFTRVPHGNGSCYRIKS